jgi:hypothetical protein
MEGEEEKCDESEAWPRWLDIRLISGYMGQYGGKLEARRDERRLK